MLQALTGLAAAAASLLVMLHWLPTPRPKRLLLAGSAIAIGCAAAAMSGLPALWPLLGISLTAAAVAWHDGLTQRIPDTLTVLTIALVVLAAVVAGGALPEWSRATLAAAALAGGYLLLALFGSLGLGDVKYAIPLGFALGWHSWTAVWQATLLAFVIGALYAVAMIIRGRSRTSHMAFGPLMAGGGVLTGILATLPG